MCMHGQPLNQCILVITFDLVATMVICLSITLDIMHMLVTFYAYSMIGV